MERQSDLTYSLYSLLLTKPGRTGNQQLPWGSYYGRKCTDASDPRQLRTWHPDNSEGWSVASEINALNALCYSMH